MSDTQCECRVECDRVSNLLQRKKEGKELGKEKKITVIDNFLFESINIIENGIKNYSSISKPNRRMLDNFFLDMVKDASGT